MSQTLSIINKTKVKLPGLPILVLKDDILGKDYVLSLAFVGPKTSRQLNKTYRAKDKPTNILSFSNSKKSGEIIICPSLVKIESKNKEKNFGKNFKNLLGFLLIHGMLHLKGLDHGTKMEKLETKYENKHFSRTKF